MLSVSSEVGRGALENGPQYMAVHVEFEKGSSAMLAYKTLEALQAEEHEPETAGL
jgi:hypothetical protein